MASWIERYREGECEAVWAELVTLGAQVREAPYADDAWAVARETMRRARSNVETLIERLDGLGYRFWDGKQGGGRPNQAMFGRPLRFGATLIAPSTPDLMLPQMFAFAKAQPPEALTSVMFEQLHN